MKHENVMVHDGWVTLVGFGHATKIDHNPIVSLGESGVKNHLLSSTIHIVDPWIASP